MGVTRIGSNLTRHWLCMTSSFRRRDTKATRSAEGLARPGPRRAQLVQERPALRIERIDTKLEHAFIYLMGRASDNGGAPAKLRAPR